MQQDWSDLKIFSKKPIRNGSKTIGLHKYSITFSISFLRDLNLPEESIYLTFGYSKKNNAICFMFSDQKTKSCVKLHMKSSGIVAASSFFKEFDIDSKKYAGKYVPEKINDGWAIYLKDSSAN